MNLQTEPKLYPLDNYRVREISVYGYLYNPYLDHLNLFSKYIKIVDIKIFIKTIRYNISIVNC